MHATSHVARNASGRSRAIDSRTSRHACLPLARRRRVLGWLKTAAGMRRVRYGGLETVGWMFTFTAAAYNLGRRRNLRVPSAAA